MDYFHYNTDVRALVGPPLPRYPILIARRFAAVGGDRQRFGEQLRQLDASDILLMYENGVGVVAVGRVLEPWNGKSYRTPWYYNVDEMGSLSGAAYEYRIDVDWFLDRSGNPITLDGLRRRIGSPRFVPRGAVRRMTKWRGEIEAMIAELQSFPLSTDHAFDLSPPTPDRAETTTYRILRDTAKAMHVKVLNKYRCQICRHTIELPDGRRYAEAHHIQPLGRPHDGPDVIENILCVCPNHHAELDYGVLRIAPSALRCVAGQVVDPKYIDYHNRVIFRSVGK